MLITYLILSILYFIYVMLMIAGWKRIYTPDNFTLPAIDISIIIAARNEAENLPKLLFDLENQDYPKDRFEVIVVDDHSTDDSTRILSAYQAKTKLKLKWITNQAKDRESPKKSAINMAVQQSTGDLILTTDADVRLPHRWISTHAAFHDSTGARFITGPIKFISDGNFISKCLNIEFASLIGSGAALIYWRSPMLSNAANVAFTKKAFYEVEGYRGNEHESSGDDIFLMKKIHTRYPGSVQFLKDQNAMVQTHPPENVWMFVHQRIRWASKWNAKGRSIADHLFPLFIFLYHTTTIVMLFNAFDSPIYTLSLLVMLFVRFMLEFIFLRSVLRFMRENISILPFLFTAMLYPFYAFFFGLAANVKSYRWKGRKY